MTRTLAATAVALLAASVASAQAPSRIQGVTTVSPVPAIVIQQERAFRDAERQAYLYRLSQPPVIVVNQFPPMPYYDPWAVQTGYPTATRWNAYATQPGAFSTAANNLYRPAPAYNTNPYSAFNTPRQTQFIRPAFR